MKSTIALHMTYEKGADDKRAAIAYFSDGVEHQRFEILSKQFEKFITSLGRDTIIRSTSANATDSLLGRLSDLVSRVEYAYWHATGIAKNLPPEEIVAQYAVLPAESFRKLVYRADIAKLKAVVSLRSALQQYHGDAIRRFKQVGRNLGAVTLDDLKDDDIFVAGLQNLADAKSKMVSENGVSFDTEVANIAKKIPECVLFNEISGMDSFIIAATVVAHIGGIERFDDFSSLSHYFGQHVVDGRMPKRKKGTNIDWNPKGRTILYMLGQCIIKNRSNPWRAQFDAFRAYEIERHEVKHPGCKTRDGHCTAMASKKVAKEILKRFYFAASGKPFVEGHVPAWVGQAQS